MYIALWVLVGVYFVIAYLVEAFVLRPRFKAMQLESELDPEMLQRHVLYQMGDENMLDSEWIGDEEEDEE